jgi:hypothetical protein
MIPSEISLARLSVDLPIDRFGQHQPHWYQAGQSTNQHIVARVSADRLTLFSSLLLFPYGFNVEFKL